MKTNTKTQPVEPATIPVTFLDCPAWGQGGQFTYDPATGIRTRDGAPLIEQAPAAGDTKLPKEETNGNV